MKSKIQKCVFAISFLLLCGGLQSFSPNNKFTKIENPSFGGAFLTFAKKFGGPVTLKDIRNTSEVGVEGCAKGSKIFQFDLQVTKSGKLSSFEGSSGQLPKEVLTSLRSLSVGDTFVFKKVKAYLPDGKSKVEVWGKKFTVV